MAEKKCPICCENVHTDERNCCDEGHFCCKNCLGKILKDRLAKTYLSRRCFVKDCTGFFMEANIYKALGDELFSIFEKKEKEKKKRLSTVTKITRCPLCRYELYVETERNSSSYDDGSSSSTSSSSSSSSSFSSSWDGDEYDDDATFEKDPVFDCPACEEVTCRRCKKLDHRPVQCVFTPEEYEESLILYVTNAMSEARVRHCPWCGTPAILTDMCNKIACAGCDHWFCYHCLWKLDDKNPYKHFGGVNEREPKENGCPLWANGRNTIKEDRRQVERAAKKATARWMERHAGCGEVSMTKLKAILEQEGQ